MKAISALLLLLILRANAFSFDEFRGAMWSVESTFSKLLTDVVTDVKIMVDCTILAMEKVLAISGAIKEPSTDECYDRTDSKNENVNKLHLDDYKTIPIRDSKKDMNDQISTSIAKVNETLTNILDNVKHDRINQIKSVLQNETNRLTEISFLLRQELEKISQQVKDVFEHAESDKSSLGSIWNDMKMLHEVEKNDKNMTEVNEISQVLNKAINVLHINTTTGVNSDEDKMKVIMRELEHESSTNNNTFKNIDRELSEWEKKRTQSETHHNLIPEQTPTSFKDLASKIFRDKDINRKETQGSRNVLEDAMNKKNPFNEESPTGQNTTESPKDTLKDSDLFGVLSEEEQKKAIDEAENIIRNSANFESILDNILDKGKHTSDVFNNPEPFDCSNFK